MKQMLKLLLMLLIPAGSTLLLAGCEEAEDAAEETGEMIEAGAEESAEAVEEAGHELEDSI